MTLLVATGLLNAYAMVLVLARPICFHTRLYRPMVLNILLSVFPLACFVGALEAFDAGASQGRGGWWVLVAAVAVVLWFCFLPNSSYLITELNLSHRTVDPETATVPLWYDIVLVLAMALSGIVNTLVTVFTAQYFISAIVAWDAPRPMLVAVSWTVPAVMFVIVAFGMYIGRQVRLNSWDLVRPRRLLAKLRQHFAAAHAGRQAVGFTLVHAVLLFLVYSCFVGISVGLGA